MREPAGKILSTEAMLRERGRLRARNMRLAFTNGCFDILHVGHLECLMFARRQGDALVVAVNTDAGVRQNKGPRRPINPEGERALMVAALACVDYVVLFDEPEPAALIGRLLPDVLVKGDDWSHYVSGREAVERNGGRVALFKLKPGHSTTDVIGRVLAAETGEPQR